MKKNASTANPLSPRNVAIVIPTRSPPAISDHETAPARSAPKAKARLTPAPTSKSCRREPRLCFQTPGPTLAREYRTAAARSGTDRLSLSLRERLSTIAQASAAHSEVRITAGVDSPATAGSGIVHLHRKAPP